MISSGYLYHYQALSHVSTFKMHYEGTIKESITPNLFTSNCCFFAREKKLTLFFIKKPITLQHFHIYLRL